MAQINELRRSTFDDPSLAEVQAYRRRAATEWLPTRTAVLERASLARALHDDLIQSLISAQMRVYAARQRVARKSKVVAAELLGIEKLLHQQVMSVRDLMQRVKPIRIEPQDLVDHLAGYVRKFAADTGIDARLSGDVGRVSLSASMCTEVARLVQEALVNVRKHSGARKVRVRLSNAAGHWFVVIEDDGRGLAAVATARADSRRTPERRPSPTVIKECVRALNGDLRLRSSAAGGLRLEITFPIAETPSRLRPRARKKMARVALAQIIPAEPLRSATAARPHACGGSRR